MGQKDGGMRKEGRTERCGRTRVALSETVRNRSCDYQSRATEARSELVRRRMAAFGADLFVHVVIMPLIWP